MAIDLAELLTGFADDRCVNQRHDLFDMADREIIEQRFVSVLQRAHEDMTLDVDIVHVQALIGPHGLLIHRIDLRRQQTEQTEFLPLLGRECGALVQPRLAHDLYDPVVRRLDAGHGAVSPCWILVV